MTKTRLEDSKVAKFLHELNRLMEESGILVTGNAGINLRVHPEFKGYMAVKWPKGEGCDLRPINKQVIYPADPFKPCGKPAVLIKPHPK